MDEISLLPSWEDAADSFPPALSKRTNLPAVCFRCKSLLATDYFWKYMGEPGRGWRGGGSIMTPKMS